MTILIAVVATMSVIAFVAYLIDKRRAINGKWRIPEATLLALSIAGGGIGGYIAMFACHHKTRKWYFHLVNILGIMIVIVAFVLVAMC